MPMSRPDVTTSWLTACPDLMYHALGPDTCLSARWSIWRGHTKLWTLSCDRRPALLGTPASDGMTIWIGTWSASSVSSSD